MTTTKHHRVRSADGISLAAFETGPPDAPVLVAVHGYPDNHTVWDGLAAELAGRFRVVTYDVRGAGDSDKPKGRAAYRMGRLVGDLAAVVDAVSPAAPVHLVGHDWGSVQCWPALTDGRLAGRIASYTSISGPSIDHSAVWLRNLRAHPRASLRQFAHSYYIFLFQVPSIPERLVRSARADRLIRAAGAPPGRSEADKVNGIQLYRANMLGRSRRPSLDRVTVPVQLLVPNRDPFVTVELATGAPEPWVDDLTVHVVDGGHWIAAHHPEVIAPLVADFADSAATKK